MKRLLIVLFSLFMAGLFAFPNMAFFIMFFFAYFSEYVSAVFCLIFAYNVAKFVQSKYERSLDKTVDKRDTGFYYKTTGDNLHFTFVIRDNDSRQLNRLKFMREKYFKGQ